MEPWFACVPGATVPLSRIRVIMGIWADCSVSWSEGQVPDKASPSSQGTLVFPGWDAGNVVSHKATALSFLEPLKLLGCLREDWKQGGIP